MANLFAAIADQRARAKTTSGDDILDLAQARELIKKQQKDVKAALALIRYFCDMFGACSACMGLNPECPKCQGNGKSGSAMPNREELLAWSEPALKRIGIRVVNVVERGKKSTKE